SGQDERAVAFEIHVERVEDLHAGGVRLEERKDGIGEDEHDALLPGRVPTAAEERALMEVDRLELPIRPPHVEARREAQREVARRLRGGVSLERQRRTLQDVMTHAKRLEPMHEVADLSGD